MTTHTYDFPCNQYSVQLEDAIREKFPQFSGQIEFGSDTTTIIVDAGISDSDKSALDALVHNVCYDLTQAQLDYQQTSNIQDEEQRQTAQLSVIARFLRLV